MAITNDMSLTNVMLVQSLKYHLLSVRQLASVGYDTLFGLMDVKVFKRDTLEVAFVGKLDGNLYTVDFLEESTFHATCLMAKADKGWLWHRRLAHDGMTNIQDLLKGEHILGLTNVSFEKDRVCSACMAGEATSIKAPPQEHSINFKTFGAPSRGSFWASFMGQSWWEEVWVRYCS